MSRSTIVMTVVVLTLVCFCAAGASGGPKHRFAEKGPWVSLFNGRNLDGWALLNGKATYEVEGDKIVGTTVAGSPNSFLCTEKLYGDFELEFEVLVDSALNSGVQIRSESRGDYRDGRVHGYQVEIATNGTAGFIYDEARRSTWLSPEESRQDEKKRAAFKDGKWNRYRVVCLGDWITTWVNGIRVADLTDDMTAKGFIGLQVHSFRGEQPAQVRWRNIRLRELTPTKRPRRTADALLQHMMGGGKASGVVWIDRSP